MTIWYILLVLLLGAVVFVAWLLHRSQNERQHLQTSLARAQAALQVAEAKREAAEEKVAEMKKEMQEMRGELHRDFALIAEKVIEEKSGKVSQQQRETLEKLLTPLQIHIEEFKKQVSETYSAEAKERHSLAKIVERLSEQNQTLSREANSLVEVLRGDSKVQGDWGEMILANLLEHSGLVQGREYELQEYITDRSGNKLRNEETDQRMRPDAIIHFPRERDIVIDAKVSLTAYLDYHNAERAEEKEQAIHRHLLSVRGHIDDLYKRDYSNYMESAPDFVIMFFPYEQAYNLAIHHSPDLWQLAYNKKVLMMGPTNLIGMLKILYELWSKEAQVRNVEKIVKAATSMFEKFVSFSESFAKVGQQLTSVQQTYDQAKKQLTMGRGNLRTQMERLKGMGLTTTKNFPPSMLPNDLDDESEISSSND